MNVLEDPLFMKRLNKMLDLISPKTKHAPVIIFIDDGEYEHKLEFFLFGLRSYWLGHIVFKKNTVYATEYWIIDVASRKLKFHCVGDAAKKYPDLMLDRCRFDVDGVLKKFDLAIVELV